MLTALGRFLRTGRGSDQAVARVKPAMGYPLIVLGMHRSGTSFLTGSLQLAGLDLGNHSTADKYNTKGNRENADIVAFHNAVLTARGHAWNDPPDKTGLIWTEEERMRAATLLAAYDQTGPWGFKDPRTLLMIDAWQALCPDARYVGIFRSPVAVARSLGTRFKMSEAQAFALWETYNRHLLALHDKAPFPLFSFDEDEVRLHAKLNAVLPQLGLTPLAQEVFFSPDLKHHDVPPEVIPEAISEAIPQALLEAVQVIYRALQARQC